MADENEVIVHRILLDGTGRVLRELDSSEAVSAKSRVVTPGVCIRLLD